MNNNFNESSQPVKEGDEVDVVIEAVGGKGDGIAKVRGFVLFVPNTKTGDQVRIRITKVMQNAGFAELIGEAEGPVDTKEERRPVKKKSESKISVDEETGKEKIKGDLFEAEYDPEQDSDDFGEE